MRELILKKLNELEDRENVRILLAVESGSRAWGFGSPDSDYDVRFIYVRNRDDYLRLEPYRDVIELPIEGDLDINGWDLCKALRLLRNRTRPCSSGFPRQSFTLKPRSRRSSGSSCCNTFPRSAG